MVASKKEGELHPFWGFFSFHILNGEVNITKKKVVKISLLSDEINYNSVHLLA
jgi:hypothetical protein